MGAKSRGAAVAKASAVATKKPGAVATILGMTERQSALAAKIDALAAQEGARLAKKDQAAARLVKKGAVAGALLESIKGGARAAKKDAMSLRTGAVASKRDSSPMQVKRDATTAMLDTVQKGAQVRNSRARSAASQ